MKKIIVKSKDKEIIVKNREQVFILDYFDESRQEKSWQLKIGRDAQVEYVFIGALTPPAESKFRREIIVGPGTKFNGYQVYLGVGDSQWETINYLGEQATVNNQVLFYQVGEEKLQVQDNYIFIAPGATGHFSVAGLLDGQAQAQYNSDLVIEPAAQQTDSRIDMKLCLLSATARGQLLPGLKISANEVKAGHGASTFQLSPEDLFYLRSRGLNSDQIKNLMVNSLASHLTAAISDLAVKNTLLELIAARSV